MAMIVVIAVLALTAAVSADAEQQHRFSLTPPSSNDTSPTTTTTTSSEAPALVVDEAAGAAGRFEYIEVVPGGGGAPHSKGPAAGVDPATRAGLQFLANVYNPHHWAAARGVLTDPGPGAACRGQLRTYLNALDNGTTWAVQMTDASGRYSSQFFFGNDFWLGSHTLCEEISSPFALSNPPWPVAFHVVQIKVHLDPVLTPHPRVLHLGVCLPRSCDPKDITALLQAASRPAPAAPGPQPRTAPSMEVVRVRRVPGPYVLLADTKLHILA
ncbi:Nose resistant to fluoxetine protein 6 [Frankliniella fusca]|uniref:Nose resistant to fluoxetine protein 6 n=1 Tax=Frankliniella fusca TaxID=407009 RepID=A0AAE1LBH6_9NEOP|nr:Nose resistant to fluoxetine protein 6 [Frankliniella fusca]